MLFCQQAISYNIPLSGVIIKEKANELAAKLEKKSFKASDGWFQKFVKRNGLSFKTASGESAAVDVGAAEQFKSDALPLLIADYSPQDIFNMDETGLFFKCLPNKTYCFKSDKCHGGKNSKERITVVVATNMDGSEKLELLVIGKSAKPRCFKNIKNLPVIYKSNKNAWMVSALFEEWILNLDERMVSEGRRIILFIDNCPSHPNIQQKLRNCRLQYFPPNMTSVLQPLDLGIIKALKVYYRNKLVRDQLNAIEKDELLNVNLLQCVCMLADAWQNHVKQSTIVNCFVKAGFVKSDNLICINENSIDNDPLEENVFRSNFEALAEQGFDSFEDYVTFDDNLCEGAILSDEDIIKTVQEQSSIDNDDDEIHSVPDDVVDNETISTPSQNQLEDAFQTIYAGLLTSKKLPKDSFSKFFDLKKTLLGDK
ncbi:tigger transposable element-derived protein 4-like [Toxorhynchites rutilus septentrionalis]|uniref:tigger transposable element-derived protein 4-like n=1 Tax=Toxorhynchites rutilus septentrionalis TaxID=329112 RepID=UPI002478DF2C|nr:tigger transposable element-derived protein 4-like [Toxorhynchites rutilus septentrionalis]XP_055620301.1 tigger transposable element-derived protein 4-like [Toxorhynchites rutilus septentrionalis]XP_055626329.1 tigger transposable element-derived protein 4-like [Toxorhynchites rutilus septentrionalis]XP_055626485.1 tigger transposable element-derived protein 4-like [Toxorhynchites rutilus septentrionalis]XP_055629019.1 tigger transposable element-derived protein 4-like [Toxorhynchites rutil